MSEAENVENAEIGKRIKAHREQRGLRLREMNLRTGINTGSLSKIENGHQSLTNDSMIAIAKALDITLAQLFSDIPAHNGIRGNTGDPDVGRHTRHLSEFKCLNEIPKDENVAIGIITARPNASRGGITYSVEERTTHLFGGFMVNDLDSKPDNIGCFELLDDTMEPRMYASDVVVADLGDKEIPLNGGIFVIVLDELDPQLCVRRVLPFVNKGIRIICENSRYPEMVLTAQQAAGVNIVGRVKRSSCRGGF